MGFSLKIKVWHVLCDPLKMPTNGDPPPHPNLIHPRQSNKLGQNPLIAV